MAQDVLERLTKEEENIPVRGMRAKLHVLDDYADIPKEEINEILNNTEDASPVQHQEEARKRVMEKILKRDPEYVNRRKEREEKYNKLLSKYKKNERDLHEGIWNYSSNDTKFFNTVEFLTSMYESYCKINEENEVLKEITNNKIFEQKNKEIEELKEQNRKLNGKINSMLSLEETQKVMKWFARHLIGTKEGIHVPICELAYDPLGFCREVKCSCGASYDLEDWKKL